MKKHTSYKLFSIIIILVSFSLSELNPSVQAHKGTRASILSSHQTGMLVDEETQPLNNHIPQVWVARVYFNSWQQVAAIASWIEPWEVNYEKGYLILGVSQVDYNRLLLQGFRVEIDHEYTEQVNHPLEYLPNQVQGIPGYTCYRTVDETYAAVQEIVANYPSLADWIDIGDSWEKITPDGAPGYDLMVLKLTNSAITSDKPILFIMTALHAREYATAELNTRFAEYLVENYDTDPDITWLLDYTEIHLLLHANPDGRKQAETGLSWRKNTNQSYCSPTSTNRGADLNRNFEFQWGCCGGSSEYECDNTYRGPSSASEPETQAIQSYVRAIFPDQRGELLTDPAPEDSMGIFLDIHSYSELVIWPWGFPDKPAPNGTALQTLGRKLAYFNNYHPEEAYKLYPTDGTTNDFAYGELGLAAYTFELGTTFFQSCLDFENTILPDNLPALLYAAKTSRTPYMTPAGPDTLDITVIPTSTHSSYPISLKATIDDTRYSQNNGTEASQNIIASEYYIDVPPWEAGADAYSMTAADGLFNTPTEEVTAIVDTTGIAKGRHTIFIRGQDIDGNWGAISAVFITIEPVDIFSVEKTTSTPSVVPGEILTFTLKSQLTLTGTNTYTLSITDKLPAEVDVITDSIRVNDTFTNGLYTPETHTIHHDITGIFTDTYLEEITFQVKIGNPVTFGAEIINQLIGQASTNGDRLSPPEIAEVSIKVINPHISPIFFPLLLNEN